jgi:hypothetical protein
VFYRHFKPTFDRRKLRGHAAAHAECEAHWSLVGLWLLTFDAQHQRQRQGLSPERLSVAGGPQVCRHPLRAAAALVSRPSPAITLRAAEIDSVPRLCQRLCQPCRRSASAVRATRPTRYRQSCLSGTMTRSAE